MLNKRKEESIVDLEMDFLAPYLQKFDNIGAILKINYNFNVIIHVK